MRRTRRGRLLATLVAGVMVLAACSGGGGGGDAGTVWVRAINGDPMTMGLNAQLVTGSIPRTFSAQIMDPLIFVSDDSTLSPALAESWELSADGLTLTLRLRQGVKWHDGQPFTAEDVKFNFDEIIPLSTYGAELAERVASVEITDPATVVVHLQEPYGPVLEAVAGQFMVPEHVYEGTDYVTNQANKEPIGTGPMKFAQYTPGQEVVLEKNPDYWEGEVRVDRAVFTIIPDPNSRAEALFSGEIDEAILDVSQQDRVAASENTHLMEEGNFSEYIPMMFNAQSEYLADPEVRAAVFAAADRTAIAEIALAGVAKPAKRLFPDEPAWALNTDIDFDRDFPRDLAAINATLDRAGFPRGPDGTRFTLTLRYISSLTATAATAEMVKSMLADVGIGAELVGTSGAVFTEKVYTEGEFDLAFLRTSLGAEPSIGITRWYTCNERKAAAANPSGICDPQIEAAAAAALAATDQTTRGEAYKALQARATELMIQAPLAWFNGEFPTVSTARWNGLDEPQALAERRAWLTMTPTS
jgi:peptide/nickel transport system substrate-binding protein